MSLESTSRLLDRLRVIELITAACILVALSFLLMAYRGGGMSSPAPAATASTSITAESAADHAEVVTTLRSARGALELQKTSNVGT